MASRAPVAVTQPPGTFLPQTKVTVGSHRVIIEKYLSEGGFAHVYVVRVPRENNKHEIAVLKRVAVPDKDHLANMRTEVETMKKLKGHKHIVTYIDSHASQLKGGGYEVFLLMEYCNGGGLIDFMNTRLQHRLTEPEILKIFGDCAEGVACMHYLKPPLLHRDLKVENVLIGKSISGSPIYKICDFGSAAVPRPAAKTAEEGRLIEEDVQKHTTMQYRSPEMIDVWRKQPIDEKADIWALGVLLYKLCYYTTPFENVGQMAILNATFTYPSYPSFSDRLKKLISWMLKENPQNRPNIYQVVKEVCSMRGTEVPIKDIYADRTHSEARNNQSLPAQDMLVGLQKTAPQAQTQAIPEITPMRRGRPGAAPALAQTTKKPAASPARGDPFAALDSKNYEVRADAVDELSKRFPSLDEFAIAHDGSNFAFSSSSKQPAKSEPEVQESLGDRVAHALADEVFAVKSPPAMHPRDQLSQSRAAENVAAQARQPSPVTTAASATGRPLQQRPEIQYPTPLRSGGLPYKSTGVGSSPPPPQKPKKLPEPSTRPIWRVPDVQDHDRSASQPRASEAPQAAASALHPSLLPEKRPALLDVHRSKSQTATLQAAHAASSRPSLEGGRPSQQDMHDADLARTRSLNARSRPTSMYVSSNLDYLRDQEQSRKRPSMEMRRFSQRTSQGRESAEETAIEDDIDFLRQAEESDLHRGKSMKEALRQHGHHHRKRSSLDAMRSGAKNILTGRFGEAFKRFDQSPTRENKHLDTGAHTPEARQREEDPRMLSPITGSEATPSRNSDNDSAVDETEDLPPDIKRELERRRLSEEEQRVAAAAAEYRARVATQGTGISAAPSKASTIQKRVQSLLDEGRQSPVPRKTAEGYGRYTEPAGVEAEAKSDIRADVPQTTGNRQPVLAKKPAALVGKNNNPYPKTRQQLTEVPPPTLPAHPASAPSDTAPLQRTTSRPGPSAPPKPKTLRTGGPAPWPPTQQAAEPVPLSAKPPGLAALLAKDLEGVPDYPPRDSSNNQRIPVVMNTPVPGDDLDSFSKRYPSLSGIEMVETEISSNRG